MAAQDQRPRFYEGQYLAADDVDAVVEYGHVQEARHELGAHTWGINIGLTLVERDTAGAPKQKLVYLTPGIAEDGFGRKLVALNVARLSEALFSNIPYDGSVDDPSQNNGVPPGRFVKVWLGYDEKAGQGAPPGFAACDVGDTYSRVQETYRFVIGDLTSLTDRRTQVSVAGRSLDAAQVLKTFDPTAPVLTDASIPQQQFPETTQGVRWMVPVGVVRWVVGASGGGYFVDRDIVPTDLGTARIRRMMRTYAGAVAETIGASDGALVLRNRGDDPTVTGRFQERLQSSEPLNNIFNDLVWIEGNLRVVGSTRLAGGALRFVDVSGHDGGTPLSIERLGDQNSGAGQRSLDALIGPDKQTPDNRFAVATVVADNPNPVLRQLSEKLTVLTSGNVGVGAAAPAYRLHVVGDRIHLETVDASKMLDLRTDATDVSLESLTNNLIVRAAGGAPVHNLLLNPNDADGLVGLGTAAPAYRLDVKSKNGIKLGLEGNGGGQLVLTNNPGDNKIYLEGYDQSGVGSAGEMLLTGQYGGNLPHLTFNASITSCSNQLGVGTNAPAGAVHVIGDQILLENPARTKRMVLFNTGSEVDLYTDTNRLSLRSNNHDCLINWLAGDGNVGIGTGAPTEKLHVSGKFILVDGAGSEEAYIGGDGIGGDVQVGSQNPSVTQVSCWNTTSAQWMELIASNVSSSSDARLKHSIKPLDGALQAVRKLRGVRFRWRGEKSRQPGEQIGVIAQEIAAVIPEAVGQSHGYATVALNALIPYLIESIKELSLDNESLRREFATLKKPSTSRREAESRPRAKKRRSSS